MVCGDRKYVSGCLLPGKSHGRRSLVGCSPWGRYKLDTTERLHFHFSLSCIGEGNGNPLQCSCLENPRDGEPGGLPSLGSHRVGRDWSDLAAAAEYMFFIHSGIKLETDNWEIIEKSPNICKLNTMVLNKWRDRLCSWIMKPSIINMPILPMVIYKFNVNSVKIPSEFFGGSWWVN